MWSDSSVRYCASCAVVGLDRRVIGRGTRELVRGKDHEPDLALLVLELPQPDNLGRSEEIGAADRVLELQALQLAAQLLLEGLGGHAGPRQGIARRIGRVLPADLEGGLAVDRFDQLVVPDPVAEIVGALGDEGVADHPLEHLVLEARAELGRDLCAPEALLPLPLLPQPGVARLFQSDLAAPGFRGVVRAAEVQVHDAVGAPGGEYDRERTDEDVSDPLALGAPLRAFEGVSDALKHVAGWLSWIGWRSGRDSNPRPPA
jgi:hypothetical protein